VCEREREREREREYLWKRNEVGRRMREAKALE
jgi:hypothetical protein